MAPYINQSLMKGGRLWPFFRRTRFFIYFSILFILYQTFILLAPSTSSLDNSTVPTQQRHKTFDTDNDGVTTFTPLYRDFPWYKSIHPRIVMTANISTTHLTTSERHEWMLVKVAQARTEARLAISQLPFTIEGIPGSTIHTHQATQSFRTNIDCLTQGQWVPVSSSNDIDRRLIRHVQDPLYATCDKRFYKTHASTLPRPETQYEWRPSGTNGGGGDTTCLRVLPKPTPQQWCHVLNGRHILLVGDLMQYQLHELFLDYLRDGPTVCFGELNCKDHTICADLDSRLRYLRNDILADNRRHNNMVNSTTLGSIVTWPFVASNILKTYPIIVLNRSPIAEDDDSFITSLIQTLTYIRRTSPNMLILYRSSGIGHPYCDDADTPLTKPLTDDAKKHLPFGWAELERRNAIARVIVEEAGGVFVDLAALTDTRPDGHVGGHDCLRYCIPGPLDTWLDILYQVFATLELNG